MSVQEVKNKSTVIGLTGGIACGKSMISAYFAQKGGASTIFRCNVGGFRVQ